MLPGGFEIAARKTYGHVSDGMICSARELGLGDDHAGILVLDRRRRPSPATTRSRCCGLRDDVIELEINPDRAYALSLRGVAREAALGLRRRRSATRRTATSPAPNDDGYPVRIEDPTAARCSSTRTVDRLRPGRADAAVASRRRVQLAGMRPISLAVDVTNYVMLELGQPIHGYDGDRLAGPIVVRRATAGEKLTTLDGVTAHARRRGPADHRRQRPDRPGRRDGRRDDRDLGGHDRAS